MLGVFALVRRAGRRPRCADCGAALEAGGRVCPRCGEAGLAEGAELLGGRSRAAEQPGSVGAEALPGGSHSKAKGDAASADTPRVSAVSAVLIALSGPLAGQRFPISGESLAIGRLAENDVVLAGEAMVSRQHAVITAEQGRHVLYDRDSANGTWVNGQRVFRHVLTVGDRVQIWHSEFAYNTSGDLTPAVPIPAPPAPAPTVVGQPFDGYMLEGLIGRGGMSEVFKARDPAGNLVAIKILQVTDPYLVAKFVQEGNKIGPLLRGHPNIVEVHKFDRSGDQRLYIVMEYVDAPSLRRLMGQAMAEERVVHLVGQVCSALALAHEHNIVHRDIKPENILVGQGDVAKVLDFGIAKLTSASTVTRDKIVGTPEYISPEQARGEPVSAASDVYALGILLYELLTGVVPFGRSAEGDAYSSALKVIRQHLEERPEPPRKRKPGAGISARLEKVALRALEKSPKKRYASASEMGTALGYEPVEAVALPSRQTRSACLLITQGPRQGVSLPLSDEVVVVGRSDLDPSNTAISRQHVSLFVRGDSYWLHDTSRNGTWVDNQRVYGEIPLRPGAQIVIANTVLCLVIA